MTGCLAQRYKEEIVKEIPEVDAILGTNSYEDIVNAVHQSLEGKHYENFKTLEGLPTLHTKRSVTTGGHFAYLKIAEGCNKRCTYCIIPYIRGNYRSVPMEDLIEQAKELVAAGAKELILVAQETTLYGVDLYGEKSLHRLLDELKQDRRPVLDPYHVLLSGRNIRRSDRCHDPQSESMSLSGYPDPACK